MLHIIYHIVQMLPPKRAVCLGSGYSKKGVNEDNFWKYILII